MTMTPMIACEACDGKGQRELPPVLKATFIMLKRMGETTVGYLAVQLEITPMTAHRRIERLVQIGLVRKVSKRFPARYSVA